MNKKAEGEHKIRKNYSISPKVIELIEKMKKEKRVSATNLVEICIVSEYNRTHE